LNQPLFNLRDRNIFRIEPDTIASVSVNDIEGAGALNLNLDRSEGTWSGMDGAGTTLELDVDKVNAVLDALGNLSANSYVDMERPPVPYGETDEDPYGMNNPTRIIQFTTNDNKTCILTLGKKDGSTYYATVSDYPGDIFRVSDSVINTICPPPANLAPSAEEPTEEQPEVMNLPEQNLPGESMAIPPDTSGTTDEPTGESTGQ
jgi:hypothetical protein